MTSYTIESYLTDLVYPEQGVTPQDGDHQGTVDVITVDVITVGVNTCPWGDQSVGVNDDGEKLYEEDFLDLAAAFGLAGKFAAEGDDRAYRATATALAHFNNYVDSHPELAAA